MAPKRLISLLGFLFLLVGFRAESQEVYRWIDEHGRIHLVDRISQVPEAYRGALKVYRVSSGPEKPHRTRKKEDTRSVSSQPPQGDKAGGAATARPTEGHPTLETLRQREENLIQEKERLEVLKTRFRTKKSRSRIYTRRIEELDEEAEAIKEEIEELLRSVQ